ncbi:MAG TPA: carbohydrate-binding domain-containing protein [Ruminococcus sp.]|nr:carbohydrate-binding domain-containing protein [Ruminococcus sp.]
MKKSYLKKIIAGLSTACVAASAMPVVIPAASAAETSKLYGDADCDGQVKMNDVVLVMQAISNGDQYGLEGTSDRRITAKGADLADVYERGGGLSPMDALSIQKSLLNLVELPESFKEGYSDPDSEETKIHLNNTSITVEGDYAVAEGNTVTINHSGSFYVDGTLDDGQIIVAVPDETVDPETVKIFLNGANITGKSAPAILISNAENTSINIVDGTENNISDGDTAYAGDYLGAAVIEAKDDLTIKGGELGTGILNVTANTQDAIFCNNDIKINGGIINIKTLNSTDKTNGINGKKSLTIKSGTLSVDAEGDGIKSGKGAVTVSGGNISIKAGNDAVQSETTIDISGGLLVAGGDRGLTPGTALNITGGSVYATATDYQVDTKLMSGTTQTTALLNCIDDTTNEKDGTWKKANAIAPNGGKVEFTKKYKYVLISDTSIDGAKSCSFTNVSTGNSVTHTDGKQTQFQLSLVTVFEKVDPSGTQTAEQPENPDTTDGYTITLSGKTITSNAPADACSVSNGSLTIKKEGEYTVTGEAEGVQIVVDVDKTAYPDSVVKLNFAGAKITNTTTAPVYVASIGDEVQIIAKKGTENVISDGTSHTQTYTDSDGQQNTVEGAIFARDDIKFKGAGTLTVNGNQDDAIVCKNDIKIYNGTINVNAVEDGIRGKDSVTIGDTTKSDGTPADNSGITLTVKTTNGDGIKSTNTTDSGKGYVTVNGGTINITCAGEKATLDDNSGGAGADGISAEQSFTMNDGSLTIKTYQGSTYTASGSSSGQQPGGFGGGRPGNWGGGEAGGTNKTTQSTKGIKVGGQWSYDTESVPNATYISGGNITINGGTLDINTSDDAVHCGGIMTLNGGTFNINASDDGFHSDQIINIGKKDGSYEDLQIFVGKCYEGMEAIEINQNSGTVYIISGDDGFNAGNSRASKIFGVREETTPDCRYVASSLLVKGFALNINGGLAVVNSASGDHDAFDSNANIYLNGGYICANGQEPLDCGDSGNSTSYNGGSVITMTAGNTNLNTRYSFVDNSGNVIVSFLSASGSPGQNCTNCKAYSGGTLSGGTTVNSQSGNYAVTIGGTLSGGTQITASASSGGGFGPGRPGF